MWVYACVVAVHAFAIQVHNPICNEGGLHRHHLVPSRCDGRQHTRPQPLPGRSALSANHTRRCYVSVYRIFVAFSQQIAINCFRIRVSLCVCMSVCVYVCVCMVRARIPFTLMHCHTRPFHHQSLDSLVQFS